MRIRNVGMLLNPSPCQIFPSPNMMLSIRRAGCIRRFVAFWGGSNKEANATFYLHLLRNSGNALFVRNRGISTILKDD